MVAQDEDDLSRILTNFDKITNSEEYKEVSDYLNDTIGGETEHAATRILDDIYKRCYKGV